MTLAILDCVQRRLHLYEARQRVHTEDRAWCCLELINGDLGLEDKFRSMSHVLQGTGGTIDMLRGHILAVEETSGGLSHVALYLNDEDRDQFLASILSDVNFYFSREYMPDDHLEINHRFFDRVVRAVEAKYYRIA